ERVRLVERCVLVLVVGAGVVVAAGHWWHSRLGWGWLVGAFGAGVERAVGVADLGGHGTPSSSGSSWGGPAGVGHVQGSSSRPVSQSCRSAALSSSRSRSRAVT